MMLKYIALAILICFIGNQTWSFELSYTPVVSNGPQVSNLNFNDFNNDGIIDAWYQWGYRAPRGGSQYGVTLFQGTSEGKFVEWKEWTYRDPHAVAAIGGRWLNKDIDEFLFINSPSIYNIHRWENEEFVPYDIQFEQDIIPYLLYTYNIGGLGDYNNDDQLDFVANIWFSGANYFLYNKENKFTNTIFDGQYESIFTPSDYNFDGIDDLPAVKNGQLVFYYGAAQNEQVFSVSDTINLPFTPTQFQIVDHQDNYLEFYVASATQQLFLK